MSHNNVKNSRIQLVAILISILSMVSVIGLFWAGFYFADAGGTTEQMGEQIIKAGHLFILFLGFFLIFDFASKILMTIAVLSSQP